MSDSLPGLETLKSSKPAAAAEKRARALALRVGNPRVAYSGLLSSSLFSRLFLSPPLVSFP